MPDTTYIFSAVATMAIVTFALRAIPFAVLKPLRSSALVAYLGIYMPAGIMLILVMYSLKNVSVTGPSHGIPELVAVAVTAGIHLWRKNAVLSIVVGTALYVGMVNTVFA
ncbi:branched-chain amino acid ABC transporter [Rhodococcus sp. SRB_17]|jgi:branched-subunit amino acid transport protein AzlD|uniref:branched-chain amino acid transporter permease n=1 Tax=unclassified Rhodococcus (in: high G+C Gram-positive bacteria) TaxID=192944 RepID=UPI000B93F809|nr:MULTISPECIES: AzlD domain-containing protein [unclassified Rhodococcus (in: high G+C Gram-positive bacteria)]MCJ0904992.1 AzlD domain-containing protein [Rhodococcus sp. ARC_M6]NMM86587.1 branched-chain amino acid ABC transporter [Rhodococcus sp. SRB_17]OYD68345.1 branched-subunit amino acid transport protein AzlD [Rhodococcus sp. OK302]